MPGPVLIQGRDCTIGDDGLLVLTPQCGKARVCCRNTVA
jgi:hypothetical protein